MNYRHPQPPHRIPEGLSPNDLCFAALVLSNDPRAGLRVQEEFTHFIDVLELNVLPPGDRGKNRCRGKQLKGIPVAINKQRKQDRVKWSCATNRSELSAPLVASRSSTPSPSFRPSMFARNWRTFEIASLL